MKKILGFAFAIALAFMASGCTMMKMGTAFIKLEPETQEAYAKMMDSIDTYGDPAKAMMIETKINDDVTNDDAVEAIKAITEERNMRVTGDVKMFTKEDAAPDEVKHARIISVCNLTTAKVFLNHSRYYGGFMPCRIMLVEYGNGDRFLITMDLTLAIKGGKPLPPEMLKAALIVKDTMETLIKNGAAGEF
ncbi:DUF302 domain-containing protein [Sulfurimonas sp.]|uniref:DUF302 domain-containing protein n=1 Tax=Sulfurimonas sp. TaxID=2022749 RepID=UPI003D151952